jgi:hypothetical protein
VYVRFDGASYSFLVHRIRENRFSLIVCYVLSSCLTVMVSFIFFMKEEEDESRLINRSLEKSMDKTTKECREKGSCLGNQDNGSFFPSSSDSWTTISIDFTSRRRDYLVSHVHFTSMHSFGCPER